MRKHKLAFMAFALLIVAYAVLNLLLPINAETLTRFNLTETSARTLRLSVALPLIIIWTITMYGYVRLKNYALSIEDGKDGRALSRIADGFLALALWQPLSSLIMNAASYTQNRNPQLTEEIVIVRNYIAIAVIMFIVYMTWKGSTWLIGAAKLSKDPSRSRLGLNTLIVVVSAVFAYLTLFNPAKNIPPSATTPASYYLPDWLLVTTIIIPYIFVWAWGLRAVGNIFTYSRHVKGTIYRSALGYLAVGLGCAILSLLLTRYLGSLTAWLDDLALKPILAILYALVLIIGVGSVMLAVGAKKLQRIEEV